MNTVPRAPFKSAAALKCLKAGKPVVLTQSGLVQKAIDSWSLKRLTEVIDHDFQMTVYQNPESPRFLFAYKEKTAAYEFDHSIESTQMTMTAFGEALTKAEAICAEGGKPDAYLYLQQALCQEMGGSILQEYQSFKLDWVTGLQKKLGFGDMTSNLLLIGQKGIVTPLHFDQQENFFCQIKGRKRVTLFAPEDYGNLYPYPVTHPADRQSQIGHVNQQDADTLARFPKFKQAKAFVVDLKPGDVLYIPYHWWHHVEGPWEQSISLTFWFKPKTNKETPELPLTDTQAIDNVGRNLEQLSADQIGYQESAHFFNKLSLGEQLTDDEKSHKTMLLGFLSNVLSAEDAQQLVRKIADGRFNLPIKKDTS